MPFIVRHFESLRIDVFTKHFKRSLHHTEHSIACHHSRQHTSIRHFSNYKFGSLRVVPSSLPGTVSWAGEVQLYILFDRWYLGCLCLQPERTHTSCLSFLSWASRVRGPSPSPKLCRSDTVLVGLMGVLWALALTQSIPDELWCNDFDSDLYLCTSLVATAQVIQISICVICACSGSRLRVQIVTMS